MDLGAGRFNSGHQFTSEYTLRQKVMRGLRVLMVTRFILSLGVTCWNILAALHRILICKWLGTALVYKSSWQPRLIDAALVTFSTLQARFIWRRLYTDKVR